jgi:hypothetical protein
MTAPAQEPTVIPDDPNQPGFGPPKILAAIWRVMRDVTFVAKASQYKEGRTEYKFRSIDDLARDLGTAFRTHGVFVQSEQLDFHSDRERTTNAGNKWTTVRVKICYRFTSLEDGSILAFEAWGEGADTSDKATMKAHTMALKAALGQAFLLPIDEKDPDSQRPGDDYAPAVGGGQGYDPNEAARQRQAAQRAAANEAGVTPPEQQGNRAEKVAQWVDWVRREFLNDAMTLERLAFIHMLTGQKQLLGVDAGGVPLEKRIRAEMARFGLDPNGAMPTPEQARTLAAVPQ